MRQVRSHSISDGLRRRSLHPREIRPGDWLRDLGTLRQVIAVESGPSALSPEQVLTVHFATQPDVEDFVLSIPGAVTEVVVWQQL